MYWLRWLIKVGVLLLGVGCSQPPEIPRLSKAPAHAIDKWAFDGDFSPADLRALFQTLNSDHKLDALIPYLEAPSDNSLSVWSDWFSKQVLESGGVAPSAFLFLLEQRIERKGFSQWAQWMQRWRGAEHFEVEREGLFALGNETQFSKWLFTSAPLLSPEFFLALSRTRALSQQRYKEVAKLPAITPVSEGEAFDDLKAFLTHDELQKDFDSELSLFFEKDFSHSLLRSLSEIGKYSSNLIEGFGVGLRRMLLLRPEPQELQEQHANQLDLLLKFASAANQNSNGLFAAIEEQFQQNILLEKVVSEKMQRRVDSVVARSIEESLKQPQFGKEFWLNIVFEPGAKPTESFEKLADQLVGVLESFQALRKPEDGAKNFAYSLPVYLDAYVLAKWFQARVQEQYIRWSAIDAENFMGEFWSRSVLMGDFKLPLVQEAAGGTWTVPLVSEMTSNKLREFAPRFQMYATSKFEPIKNFRYSVPSDGELPLRESLVRTLGYINKTRVFLEFGSVFRALKDYFSKPTTGSFFLLSNFETDNLMDAFNIWTGGSSLLFLRRAKEALFGGFGIANLPAGDRSLIVNLLEKRPALQQMVGELLDSVQAVGEFDEQEVEVAPLLPTPFEFYREILLKVGPGDMPWVAHLLSFLSRGEFFAERKSELGFTPVYPSLYKTIQGRTLSRWFYTLSQLNPSERLVFEGVFNALFGLQGGELQWKTHRQLLTSLWVTHPESMKKLLKRLMDLGWDLLPDLELLSYSERESLSAWLLAYQHAPLVRFFQENGDRKKAWEAISTLEKLTQSGDLRRAFQLLQRVQNVPLQRFSRIFLLAERNGEWQAFLDFAKQLVSPQVSSAVRKSALK